jgi:hypothetical protein
MPWGSVRSSFLASPLFPGLGVSYIGRERGGLACSLFQPGDMVA